MCGMSVSGVSQEDPLFLPFINPAAGHLIDGWRLSTSCSRRFNMKELTRITFALSCTSRHILWSVGAERFGNELYGEELTVVGLGIPVRAKTRIGFSGKLHRLSIKDYGDALAPAIDVAMSAVPTENVVIGVVWKNINRPDLGSSGIKIPGALVAGIGGSLSDRLAWSVEDRRGTVSNDELSLGFAFHIAEEMVVRMGYRGNTGEYSMGTTLRVHFSRLDYAFSIHPVLGATHYISLSVGSRLTGGLLK